jgi:DEAD/DEAH box helicase domain-containing protein
MDFASFLRELRETSFYKGQIAHVQQIPGRSAHFGALEKPLAPELDTALDRLGIGGLYAHQAEAVNAARDGENVTVVTATASGKTLCYNLPVLEAVLHDTRARAFYLFPTKALAQDQLGKLNDFGLFPTVRFATYDGDTPSTERRFIKRGAHIVLTNPDMLHVGILPYHSTWSAFLAHLKYVVVDEMHTYRGVFGAHVAQILRRLRRICQFYGSDPQFLCCSATIANPEELTQRLTGVERTVVVDNNGAPSGPRTFVFWNPPVVDAESGQRRSAHIEATSLFTNLVANGVRNITFTKARKSAELILRYSLNEFAQNARPDLAEKIMAYRSGYTPKERRNIEQGLFTGRLIGVTATNALELGVDVGGLDATVLTGYPGTIASAWQQAGRAGRGGDESLSVLIALDNPLDQFLMRHPDYFFGRPHERAIVDTDNLRILGQHLLCAAYERTLSTEDLATFGPNASIALQTLEEEGKVVRRNGQWRFMHADYPAAAVNIRSASEGAFRIVDSERGEKLIGTVESGIAFKNLHEGAIYLHLGETYLVERLDIEQRTAYVRPVEANYYTEAREYSGILILNTRQKRTMGHTEACFGEVVVTNRVVGYRRKKLFSDDVLEVVDLNLPEQTFETEAFWFTVPGAQMVDLVQEGGDLAGSIHAVEHAAIGMMPLLATCDRWDLGGVSHPEHPDTALPTVFIYDAYPGGVGIAENTFAFMEELLRATRDIIAACPCAEGCPSCIQSPKCGNNNEPLDKHGACRLLELVLEEKPQGVTV